MKFSDAAKKIISALAPTLATALGGPLAGAATAQIVKSLGGSEESAEAAIVSADPQTLIQLKQADADFQKFLLDHDLDLEKINAADRADARNREIQLRDITPAVLAYAVTLGFFGTLGFMLIYGKPVAGGEALLVMLGSLGTAWAGITAYYFGSSAGSKHKTELLAK
jgi:hypothetical protein